MTYIVATGLILILLAFCAGRALGRAESKSGTEVKILPSIKPKRKRTAEEDRALIISENIENYGTNVPQKEVKL